MPSDDNGDVADADEMTSGSKEHAWDREILSPGDEGEFASDDDSGEWEDTASAGADGCGEWHVTFIIAWSHFTCHAAGRCHTVHVT